MSLELTPPESLANPAPLAAPAPVAVVPQTEAEKVIKLDQSLTKGLDDKVTEFVNTVLKNDVHSETFTQKINAIHSLGNAEMRASAATSNRMLDRPMKAMENGLLDSKSEVARSLTDLRKTVEDLDP